MIVKLTFISYKLGITKFNSKSLEYNINQPDNQKIQQKRCMCQSDLAFSPQNSHINDLNLI